MTEQRKGISTRPSDQVEGGGIISSGEVEVIGAEYTNAWVYPNSTQTATGLLLTLLDSEGAEIPGNFYSYGEAKNVEVSGDGCYLFPLSGQTGFVKQSNLALLMASLTDAGYPEDKHPEDGNVKQLLVGLKATVIRKEQPKREGFTQTQSKTGRVATVLLFNKVISLPWEKKKSTAAKTTVKGKTNAAPSQEAVDEKTAALLVTIVGEEGTVNRKVIGMKAYQHESMKGDPHRNVYSGRISKPEFLESEELGCGTLWMFDKESGEISAQA